MSTSEGGSRSLKRKNTLDWEDYFMGVAFLAAQRSKDPRTQVGACIVSDDNKIVGVGYNGFPTGCSDDVFPWGRGTTPLDSKHFYVCHAELNAVLNTSTGTPKGCRMFVALFPCNECAKVIIQSGIKEVIYMSKKNFRKPEVQASEKMFEAARVTCRQFQPKRRKIEIDFNTLDKSSDKSSDE